MCHCLGSAGNRQFPEIVCRLFEDQRSPSSANVSKAYPKGMEPRVNFP
jgi:hypothetical protein